MIDEKTVRRLETRIESAVCDVILDLGLKCLPLLPSRQTMHLMAKAAVAVYEAAVENKRAETDSPGDVSSRNPESR